MIQVAAERPKDGTVLVGSALRRLSSADRTLTINSVDVQPSNVVRDLRVLLDSELTLKHHVTGSPVRVSTTVQAQAAETSRRR